MSFRGSPLNPLDYLRQMDERIRKIEGLTGTARIPSQRIGEFIVEIDGEVSGTGRPLIKLTEVATGIVTYCCFDNDETEADCPEIPPFSWYQVVAAPTEFPAYPVPRSMLLIEAGVVMQSGVDNIVFDVKTNDGVAYTVYAEDVPIQRYDINVIASQHDRLSVEVTDVGAGNCEDLTIVLRTCSTPTVVYES